MKYFQFLTEDAYVQTGDYQVRKFYIPGQHYLQGVGLAGAEVWTDVTPGAPGFDTTHSFTAPETGIYRFVAEFTEDNTANDTATLTVNDVEVEIVSIAKGTTVPLSLDLVLSKNDEVEVSLGSAHVSISSAFVITQSNAEVFPYFSRDWAAFSDGDDAAKGYDPGSYSIGVKPSYLEVKVPAVKKVSLLYYVSENSTQEERTLVQYDGTLTDAITDGIVATGGARLVYTEEEYIDTFVSKDTETFNRFGKVLPAGVSYSQVNELSSLTGTFTDTGGNLGTFTIYVQPIFMHNQLPLFDYIYLYHGLQDGFTVDAGTSGHFLRWLGAQDSDAIAPINRWGNALIRDGYRFDPLTGTLSKPADAPTTEDGVTVKYGDDYNIRNFRRY